MVAQYFAQINDNNIVTNVAVVTTEFMAANPDRYTGTWVETFIDDSNKTYAGLGFTYNQQTQDFTRPIIEPVEPLNEP